MGEGGSDNRGMDGWKGGGDLGGKRVCGKMGKGAWVSDRFERSLSTIEGKDGQGLQRRISMRGGLFGGGGRVLRRGNGWIEWMDG